MGTVPLTVVELSTFLRSAVKIWNEDERSEFVNYIAYNAEDGDVIPHTGGLRKVRWTRHGIGKRGGARVIYFYHDHDTPLFLITVYAKSDQEDLRPADKKIFSEFIVQLKRGLRHENRHSNNGKNI